MAAIFRTIRAPGVGRLLAVFGAFRAAEFGVWISMTTVAFGFGGVREATAVLVAQLLPAAFFAAFVGGWSDRRGARRVLTTGLIVQSAAMFAIGSRSRRARRTCSRTRARSSRPVPSPRPGPSSRR